MTSRQKESEKVVSPLLRSMVGEYFDKKGNTMTLTFGPWQSVTALMKNKKNHIIMHDSGTGKLDPDGEIENSGKKEVFFTIF